MVEVKSGAGADSTMFDKVVVLEVVNSIATVRMDSTSQTLQMRADLLPAKSDPPVAGETWYVSRDMGQWRFVATTSWVKTVEPVGSVIMFAGSQAPVGYLLCNGAIVSRTDYAALFKVIGTRYGVGDGTTTFALPNMTARFPRGSTSPGASGGATAHTHTFNDGGHTHSTPNHSHPLSDNGKAQIWFGATNTYGRGTTAGGSTWNTTAQRIQASEAINTTATTASVGAALDGATDSGGASTTGSGTASGTTSSTSQIPPYVDLAYLIRY